MPHPDEREKNPFTITVDAERLANHVLTITKNTKRFPDYTEMVLKKERWRKGYIHRTAGFPDKLG